MTKIYYMHWLIFKDTAAGWNTVLLHLLFINSLHLYATHLIV